jgi:hypothetical protein
MKRKFHAKTHVVNSPGCALSECLIAGLFLSCLFTGQAAAQSLPQSPVPASSVHRHNSPSAEDASGSTIPVANVLEKRPGAVTIDNIQVAIPDLIVLNQDGKERRFYSDLIKDKVVVLSFFFTSCVSVCPAMNLALAKLQTNLADRIGKDLFIVTVTKDPRSSHSLRSRNHVQVGRQ